MRTITLLLLLATFSAQAQVDLEQRRAEVTRAEKAFAQTMADRSFEAFMSHIADDAVFLNGGQPLRGKQAIAAHWQQFFKADTPAPFAWGPDLVDVTGSGDLGYTEGRVVGAEGAVIARFVSTWRRDSDGSWRIVFDNGGCACPGDVPKNDAKPGE